jgi:hypothetical protein
MKHIALSLFVLGVVSVQAGRITSIASTSN